MSNPYNLNEDDVMDLNAYDIYERALETYCLIEDIDQEEYNPVIENEQLRNARLIEYLNPDIDLEERIQIYIAYKEFEPYRENDYLSLYRENEIFEKILIERGYYREEPERDEFEYEEKEQEIEVETFEEPEEPIEEEPEKETSKEKDFEPDPQEKPEKIEKEVVSRLYQHLSKEQNEKEYQERIDAYCEKKNITRDEYDEIVRNAKSPKELPEPEYRNIDRSDEERIEIYISHKNIPGRIFKDSPQMEVFVRDKEERYQEAVQREWTYMEHSMEVFAYQTNDHDYTLHEKFHKDLGSNYEEAKAVLSKTIFLQPELENYSDYAKLEETRNLFDKLYQEDLKEYCEKNNITEREYHDRFDNERDLSQLPSFEKYNINRSYEDRQEIEYHGLVKKHCRENGLTEREYHDRFDNERNLNRLRDIEILNPNRSLEQIRTIASHSIERARTKYERRNHERELQRESKEYVKNSKEYRDARQDYMERNNISLNQYKEIISLARDLKEYPPCEALNLRRPLAERNSLYELEKERCISEQKRVNPSTYERFNPNLPAEERLKHTEIEKNIHNYEKEVDAYCKKHHITRDAYSEIIKNAPDIKGYPYPERLNPELSKEDREYLDKKLELSKSVERENNKGRTEYYNRGQERVDALVEYEKARNDVCFREGIKVVDYIERMSNTKDIRDLNPIEALNPTRPMQQRNEIYELEKERNLQHSKKSTAHERFNPNTSYDDRQAEFQKLPTKQRKEQERTEHNRDVKQYCKLSKLSEEQYKEKVKTAKDYKNYPSAEYSNSDHPMDLRLKIYEHSMYSSDIRFVSPEFDKLLKIDRGAESPSLYVNTEREDYQRALEEYCKENNISKLEYKETIDKITDPRDLPKIEALNPFRSEEDRLDIYILHRLDPDKNFDIYNPVYEKALCEREIEAYCRDHDITKEQYEIIKDNAPDLNHLPSPEQYNPDISREDKLLIDHSLRDPMIEYELARDLYLLENGLSKADYKENLSHITDIRDLAPCEALNPARTIEERTAIYEIEKTRCINLEHFKEENKSIYERYNPNISQAERNEHKNHERELFFYERGVREYCNEHNIDRTTYDRIVDNASDIRNLPYPELNNPNIPEEQRQIFRDIIKDPLLEYEVLRKEHCNREGISVEEYKEIIANTKNIRDLDPIEALNPTRTGEERNRIYEAEKQRCKSQEHSKIIDKSDYEKYNPNLTKDERQAYKEASEHERIYKEAVEKRCEKENITKEEYDKQYSKERNPSILPAEEALNPNRPMMTRVAVYGIHHESLSKDYPSLTGLEERYMEQQRAYFREVDKYCKEHDIGKEEYIKQIMNTRTSKEDISLPEPERLNPNLPKEIRDKIDPDKDPRIEYERLRDEHCKSEGISLREYKEDIILRGYVLSLEQKNPSIDSSQNKDTEHIRYAFSINEYCKEENISAKQYAERVEKAMGDSLKMPFAEMNKPGIDKNTHNIMRIEYEYSHFNFNEDRSRYEQDKFYQYKVEEYCKQKNIDKEEYERQFSDSKNIKKVPEIEVHNPNRNNEERMKIYEHNFDSKNRTVEIYELNRILKEREFGHDSRFDRTSTIKEIKDSYEKAVDKYCKEQNITRDEYNEKITTNKIKELPPIEYKNPTRADHERISIYEYHRDKPDHTINDPEFNKVLKEREFGHRSHLYENQSPREAKELYEKAVNEFCKKEGITKEQYVERISNIKDTKNLPEPEVLNPNRSDKERIDLYSHIREQKEHFINSHELNKALKQREFHHETKMYVHKTPAEEREYYEKRVDYYCRENGITKDEYKERVEKARDSIDMPKVEYLNPQRSDMERIEIYMAHKYEPSKVKDSPQMEHLVKEYGKQIYDRKVAEYCRENDVSQKQYHENARNFYKNDLSPDHLYSSKVEIFNLSKPAEKTKEVFEHYISTKDQEREVKEYCKTHNLSRDEYISEQYKKEPYEYNAREEFNKQREEYCKENNLTLQEYKEKIIREEIPISLERDNPSLKDSINPDKDPLPIRDDADRLYAFARIEYMKEHNLREEDYKQLCEKTKSPSEKPYPEMHNPNLSKEERCLVRYEYEIDKYCKDHGMNRPQYEKNVAQGKRYEPEIWKERAEYEKAVKEYCQEKGILRTEYDYRDKFEDDRAKEIEKRRPPEHESKLFTQKSIEQQRNEYERDVNTYCKKEGIDKEEYERRASSKDVYQIPVSEAKNIDRSDVDRINIYMLNRDDMKLDKSDRLEMEKAADKYMRDISEINIKNYCKNHDIDRTQYDRMVESGKKLEPEIEREKAEYRLAKNDYMHQNKMSPEEYERKAASKNFREVPPCESKNPDRSDRERDLINRINEPKRDYPVKVGNCHNYEKAVDKYCKDHNLSKDDYYKKVDSEKDKSKLPGPEKMKLSPEERYAKEVKDYCRENNITTKEYKNIVNEARCREERSITEMYNPNAPKSIRFEAQYERDIKEYCSKEGITRDQYNERVDKAQSQHELPQPERWHARIEYERAVEDYCRDYQITRSEYDKQAKSTDKPEPESKNYNLSRVERYEIQYEHEVKNYCKENHISRDEYDKLVEEGTKYLKPERLIPVIEYEREVKEYCKEHDISRTEYDRENRMTASNREVHAPESKNPDLDPKRQEVIRKFHEKDTKEIDPNSERKNEQIRNVYFERELNKYCEEHDCTRKDALTSLNNAVQKGEPTHEFTFGQWHKDEQIREVCMKDYNEQLKQQEKEHEPEKDREDRSEQEHKVVINGR